MPVSFSASYLLLWTIVGFQGLLILALLQRLSHVQKLAEDGMLGGQQLLVGAQAPEFASIDRRTNHPVDLNTLRGKGGIILFLSSECSICKRLLDTFQGLTMPTQTRIFAFCQSVDSTCDAFIALLPNNISGLIDGADRVAAKYHVSAFPTAVVLDGDLIIRSYHYPKTGTDLIGLLETLASQNSPVFVTDTVA